MGAGASTNVSDQTQNALQHLPRASKEDYSMLANTMLPASEATASNKETAVRLKMALSTKDGWDELQSVFRAFRTNLDDAVSADEWGSIVCEDEALRNKYFGDATPEEIAAQFDHMDEKCAKQHTILSHRSKSQIRAHHALPTPDVYFARSSRASGKSELMWEEFVDGAISLGAAVTLGDALSTPEGEEELRAVFDIINPDVDGRVSLRTWGQTLIANPDVLARFTGLEASTSPRFTAFFMLGRVDTWMAKIFRRLGLREDDYVTWEEFRDGGRATGTM